MVIFGGFAVAVTFWLMRSGERGAELADVFQVPISLLTLALAVAALWPEADQELVPPQRTLRQQLAARLRPYLTVRVGLTMAAVVVLLISIGLYGPATLERTKVWVYGCDHPTLLRALTSPDQLQPAIVLAERYEQWTAQRHYGCPTVEIYVYAAPQHAVRNAIVSDWPSAVLREVGVRPDVWLTGSTELDEVRAMAPAGVITRDGAIAWSPVVLGVRPEAGLGEPNGRSWPAFVRHVMDSGLEFVRPNPADTAIGRLSTALVYGTAGPVDPAWARAVEQRIGRSLDSGDYPLGDDLDVLCRYRELDPPRTAVVVSEQALVRFNRGDPLGRGCGNQVRALGVAGLRALYPDGGAAVQHQLVGFEWSGERQAAEVAELAGWLAADDDGRRALVEVGLRPVGDGPVGYPISADNGATPDGLVDDEPLAGAVLAETVLQYEAAQRRGRVLLALDSSGSMRASAGDGTRLQAAARGVEQALTLMGERDEFGLTVFPAGPDGLGVRTAVPIGPRDGDVRGQSRRQAAAAELAAARPAGNTPLYRAIVEGVAAVGPSDASRVSALVVLTDGEDTTSGLDPQQVIGAIRDAGVRVFVVAIGEVTCSAAPLPEITERTGGRCVEADPTSIDTELAALFGGLWGVS